MDNIIRNIHYSPPIHIARCLLSLYARRTHPPFIHPASTSSSIHPAHSCLDHFLHPCTVDFFLPPSAVLTARIASPTHCVSDASTMPRPGLASRLTAAPCQSRTSSRFSRGRPPYVSWTESSPDRHRRKTASDGLRRHWRLASSQALSCSHANLGCDCVLSALANLRLRPWSRPPAPCSRRRTTTLVWFRASLRPRRSPIHWRRTSSTRSRGYLPIPATANL